MGILNLLNVDDCSFENKFLNLKRIFRFFLNTYPRRLAGFKPMNQNQMLKNNLYRYILILIQIKSHDKYTVMAYSCGTLAALQIGMTVVGQMKQSSEIKSEGCLLADYPEIIRFSLNTLDF